MNDLRARFSKVLARDEVYLANHSLGRPLDRMAADVQIALDLWYSRMDDSWEPWLQEVNRWRGNIAKLIGASGPDRIVPKTSAGQGLRAVLNAFPQDRPVKVVATRGEFDSVDFILKAYAHSGRAKVAWVEPSSDEAGVPLFSADAILGALTPGPGLVVVSLVFFGTGQILQDVEKLIAGAHERGWLVLLDMYHAVGVFPADFAAFGADFGIGGSYKYLRGGPGACWLALGQTVTDDFHTLDTGWFAKKNTFGYERSDTPEFAGSGDGWLESTPPILMPYQAKSGLEFVLEFGVETLRKRSLCQQAEMRSIFRKRGIELFEPSDPSRFGAFSLLRHTRAGDLCRALKEKGVNVDSRGEFVRFGPDILNTEDEFERAAAVVAEALGSSPGR
ncbi:MAG TPA: aminotransferase class V-fold PLP-dependent enzyme [Fimbriimonadaceae bacterium]|nr:aminotransferase class V-fold PLP-dependent enzyme [Fimbriimonadaceae bacterium]